MGQSKSAKRRAGKQNSKNKAKLLKDEIDKVRSNTFSNLVSPEEFTDSVENVAKLQIDLTNLQTDIENKERELFEKDNIVENLKTTIARKNIEIKNLKRYTNDIDCKIKCLEESFAKKDSDLEHIQVIYFEKEKEIRKSQEEFNKSYFEIISLEHRLEVQRKTLKKLLSSENSIFKAYQKRILQMSETLQPLQNESEKKKVEFEAISEEITYTVKKIEDANDILKNLRTSLDTTYKTIDLFHDKLYDSLQNQTGKLQCVMCSEKTRSITFAPCHHFVSCGECSSKVSTCPICKEIITSRQKTFF